MDTESLPVPPVTALNSDGLGAEEDPIGVGAALAFADVAFGDVGCVGCDGCGAEATAAGLDVDPVVVLGVAPASIVVDGKFTSLFVSLTAPTTAVADCRDIAIGARGMTSRGEIECTASVALIALGTIADAEPTMPLSTGVTDCRATEDVVMSAVPGARDAVASVALVALGTIADAEPTTLLSTGVTDCRATEDIVTTGVVMTGVVPGARYVVASVALVSLGTIVDAEPIPASALLAAGMSVAAVLMGPAAAGTGDVVGRPGAIEDTGASMV